jgi:hypothetical protein
MNQAKAKDTSAEVIYHRRQSSDWMLSNFWPEWEVVYRNYLCYREARLDPNDKTGKTYDLDATSIALPDTWGWVRRLVARLTAQIPNMRHRSDNIEASELISRTLMYQWDRGGAQKQQKKHVLQAALFGWSVKAWWWDKQVRTRRKKVDPFKASEAEFLEIAQQYGVPPEALMVNPQLMVQLLQANGRGKYLPVEYDYCAYEGPRSEVLFPGDCYPEPGFTSLQESSRFIVERRHGREWMDRAAMAYPEFAEGLEKLLQRSPKGTQPRELRLSDKGSLYDRLKSAVGQTALPPEMGDTYGTDKWTFTEMHIPGRNPRWVVVAEDDVFIGDVPHPFDLDGKIPFTECVLIDNVMHGIGDSTARVLTPLQEMHNRQTSQRFDVVDRILRPNVFTADRQLYDNPDRVKPGNGFNIVYSALGGNALQAENLGPALSAVAVALQDEGAQMRAWQVGTGDSNMSMAANVDPNQNRTATGARIAAFNQDVLTKDLLDRYSVSLSEDAEIMFMLNRSELGDAINFEAALYRRTPNAAQDVIRDRWVQVEPQLFNRDGQITVEVGSTLADDDEAKVQKAQMMYSMFNGHPLVNQEKLRDTVLTALGKGNELEQFAAPPPPPPPPEDNTRTSISLSIKFEDLPDEVKAVVLQQAVLPKVGAQQGEPLLSGPQAPPDGGGPLPPPPAPMPEMMPGMQTPPDAVEAMSSLAMSGRGAY